ncbi:unnamed protein product, partial [Didymodactylos carnosus]
MILDSEKRLYYCNFDNWNDQCFTSMISTQTGQVTLGNNPPILPSSDVTSITTNTNSDELCQLPYRTALDSTFDMYFCHRIGPRPFYCPTQSGKNGTCNLGRFAYVPMSVTQDITSYELAVQYGIIGIQRLSYYYYFTNPESDASITVQLETKGGNRSIIDIVTSHQQFYNGWIRHEQTFTSAVPAYKLFYIHIIQYLDLEISTTETTPTMATETTSTLTIETTPTLTTETTSTLITETTPTLTIETTPIVTTETTSTLIT